MDEVLDLKNEAFRAVFRDRLERDFLAFAVFFHRVLEGDDFVIGRHHLMLVDELMRMYRGELGGGSRHLVVNMPPRYGKTSLMLYFCAWLYAKHPKQRVMHLSCSDSLVVENSKKILRLLRSGEYQSLWPVTFRQELEHDWVLESGGSFYASSTGGQVIGKGCGLTTTGEWGGFMWIDDPLKPADSDSDTVRGNVNDLCGWAIRTRRNSRDTPVVMVMQRLHDQDTTGYLLGGETAAQYFVLKMAAQCEDGTALWPYKHTWDELELERKNDKWLFAAQYQQDPVPDDGEYFSEADARFYSKAPEGLAYYISSDIALSEGKGDFTEHAVIGVDGKDNCYLVDWWSGRVDDVEVVESLVRMAKIWRPKFLIQESGPTWKAIEGSLNKALRDERIYVHIEVVSHSAGDKTMKTRGFQGLWRNNKVYLPIGFKWADELLAQMKRFPKGKFDDKVDALGNFGRCIDKITGATARPVEEKKTAARGLRIVGRAGDWMGI